jgi:hypothetical protein
MPHRRIRHGLSTPLGFCENHTRQPRAAGGLTHEEIAAVRHWVRGSGPRPAEDLIGRARNWADGEGLGFVHMAVRKNWVEGLCRLKAAGFDLHHGPWALSPVWLARTPEMVQFFMKDQAGVLATPTFTPDGRWASPGWEALGAQLMLRERFLRDWMHPILIAPTESVFEAWLAWPTPLVTPLNVMLTPNAAAKNTKAPPFVRGTLLGFLLQQALAWTDGRYTRLEKGWFGRAGTQGKAIALLVEAAGIDGVIGEDAMTPTLLAARLLEGEAVNLTHPRLVPGSLFSMQPGEDDTRLHPVVALVQALVDNGLDLTQPWPGQGGGRWLDGLDRWLPRCGAQGRVLLSVLVRDRLETHVGVEIGGVRRGRL